MTAADDRIDFVVVGGGPAGMSAALLAGQNGIDTMLLESADRLGGQMRWADAPIPDLLGAYAANGDALADRFTAHLKSSPARIRMRASTHAVHADQHRARVTLADGESITARRILLATGLRPRRLGVPGEDLADPSASPRRDVEKWRGRKLAVVGGGDEACSLATDLARHAAEVTLLVRGTPRARPVFANAAKSHPRVTLHQGAVVSHFERVSGFDQNGTTLRVVLTSGAILKKDDVFIRIGVEPAMPLIEPELERRADGCLRVDASLRTSCGRLFAAGDLIRPPGQHYIAAALADGTVAARRVEDDLAGSAADT